MTTLTVCADDDAATVLGRYHEYADIREQLATIGVEFERWDASRPLDAAAGPEEVIAAYQEAIDLLNTRYGFVSIDVVAMQPDDPELEAKRGKFLAEHTHADFETRFFVDGAGMFYIRSGGRVYMTECTRGDLINLPANTTHWFDMGPRPYFKAIRFFRIPEGWVGHFTGDPIADRFPRYEAAR